jgi:hypothetical protein
MFTYSELQDFAALLLAGAFLIGLYLIFFGD